MARMATISNRPRVDPERRHANNGGRFSKLTESQIDEMVIRYNKGETQKALGERFGVSVSTVRRYLRSRE